MMMDPDKGLLKCAECDAKFPSTELLQVHQRRHEMTLNLSTKPVIAVAATSSTSLSTPSVSKGSHSAGILSCFVDETPTPTRFIRNCEEVGLFQDLQNVNPFDEDFKKAASGSATATPSGEGFEFTFSASVIGAPGTPTQETALCLKTPNRSKRRYSDQDTLNTPQVFPYFLNFSSSGSSNANTAASQGLFSTPTTGSVSGPQTHGSSPIILATESGCRHVIQSTTLGSPVVSTTSYNHEEHVSIIAYTSAISQQTNPNKNNNADVATKKVESPKTASELLKNTVSSLSTVPVKSPVTPSSHHGSSSRTSLLRIRSKSHLKLDLKTVISNKSKTKALNLNDESSDSGSGSKQYNSNKKLHSDSDVDPDSKKKLLDRNKAAAHRSRERRKQWIYGLESRCRALETLLAESQAEIARLKSENETLRSQLGNKNGTQEKPKTDDGVAALTSTKEPSITIHHVNGKDAQNFQEPLAIDNADVSVANGGVVAAIVSPIVLPTVKAKRGRPKKGQERRIPIQSVSIVGLTSETKTVPKIPLLPLPRLKK